MLRHFFCCLWILVGVCVFSMAHAQDESRDTSAEKRMIDRAVSQYVCTDHRFDRTRELESVFDQGSYCGNESILAAKLRRYQFLFVTGIIYHTPENREDFYQSYFGEVMRWMERQSIPYYKIPTQANELPQNNIEIVDVAVRAREQEIRKPIVIITHSKGALDIAHYLTQTWSKTTGATRPNIVGWIPIQMPFWGSYSSTEGLKSGYKRILGDMDEYFQGTSPEFAQMLSTQRALENYAEFHNPENKTRFQRVLNDPALHILQVKSWVQDPNHFRQSMRDKHAQLDWFGMLPDFSQIPSDGFAEYRSQRIPCADSITLKNVDHWDLVWPNYRDNTKEVLAMYQSIFSVWLNVTNSRLRR